MEKNLLFEETKKRLINIMEYVVADGASTIDEDGDENAEEGGEEPTNSGGDNEEMPPMGDEQGEMGGMGANPMDTNQNDMGTDQTMGGQGGPEGFNPQVGDMSMGDPSMNGGNSEVGADDEVIDISDLTDAQEETQKDVEQFSDKFDKVMKALGAFEELLKSNDAKIENLKSEFERRNPTQIEKLSMQTAKSGPYTQTPSDFWREKEATSNYRVEDDNNGQEQGQYVITKNDVNGDTNWKAIADSLDNDDDFIYNQTLNGVLKF